ncbi:hypothetical protein MAH1_17020 [Sessilibacter sp. MAH1]
MLKSIAVVLPLFFSVNAFADYCGAEVLAELNRILSSDTKVDVEKDYASGEFKFLATYGLTLNFPGLIKVQAKQVRANGQFKAIEGSGDNLCFVSWYSRSETACINQYISTCNTVLAAKLAL